MFGHHLQHRLVRSSGAAVVMGSIVFASTAIACGWWGDGEGDDGGETVTIGVDGIAIAGGASAENPETLTHRANELRRFGASGYAGALRLYRQAADQGFAPAQNNLGAMYEEGLGVPPDLSAAYRWYLRAANLGERHAQHSVAMMLLNGRGTEQNTEEGLEWMERASRNGHQSAAADLGRFYAEGLHVQRNPDAARNWWQRAADLGHPEARTKLKALGSATGGPAR